MYSRIMLIILSVVTNLAVAQQGDLSAYDLANPPSGVGQAFDQNTRQGAFAGQGIAIPRQPSFGAPQPDLNPSIPQSEVSVPQGGNNCSYLRDRFGRIYGVNCY